MSLDVGYWNFFWALVIQGGAMGLLFIPLTTITNDPIPKERMGNATSIFNLLRNIGGSVGIATSTTLLARRAQIHTNFLGGHVDVYGLASRAELQGIAGALVQRGVDPLHGRFRLPHVAAELLP